MDAQQKINRAVTMLAWCDGDDGLNAIIDGLRRKYKDEWAATADTDETKRRELYAKVKALTDVEGEIRRIIADGNNAAAELEAAKTQGPQFF